MASSRYNSNIIMCWQSVQLPVTGWPDVETPVSCVRWLKHTADKVHPSTDREAIRLTSNSCQRGLWTVVAAAFALQKLVQPATPSRPFNDHLQCAA